MGIGSIANLINGFNGSVHCSIKANGKISTHDIFVDGSGQTYAGNIKLLAKCKKERSW